MRSNSLKNSAELRGLVQKDTSGVTNYLNRTFRSFYNPGSDLTNLKRVLTNIRGKLNKNNQHYEKIGASLYAGHSLRVNGQKTLKDIFVFLRDIDELYKREDFSIKIPQLDFIDKKYDGELVLALEGALFEDLKLYNPETNDRFFLDNIELGFLPDQVTEYWVLFDGEHAVCANYVEVLQAVYRFIGDAIFQAGFLKRFRIRMFFANDYQEIIALDELICGDIVYRNETYFINEGLWYRAGQDFQEALKRSINSIHFIPPEELSLLEFSHSDEDQFNYGHNLLPAILHRKFIQIENQRGPIEFCDLIGQIQGQPHLIHIKRGTGAALRDLFAQGYVASIYYHESEEFKGKVHAGDFIDRSPRALEQREKDYLSTLVGRVTPDFTVVFAIYDNTPSHRITAGENTTLNYLNGALTAFAKVDLIDRVTALRAIGYNVAVTRIKPYPV